MSTKYIIAVDVGRTSLKPYGNAPKVLQWDGSWQWGNPKNYFTVQNGFGDEFDEWLISDTDGRVFTKAQAERWLSEQESCEYWAIRVRVKANTLKGNL